jgi:molecular chaperone GrpE (heat shock protein)
MLEQRLWSDGEGRNFDFIKELIQSKGSTIEQVKSLLEIAERYTSSALNGHVGEVVCGLIKKDEITNRSLFLPYLNKLYSWEGEWGWSATVQGLREEIYLEMLEGSSKEAGDQALTSAVHRFLRTRTQVLDLEVQGLKGDVQKSEQKIHELESLLAEKEQVVRELRGSYGGDTAQARFNERVRVVKDLASSVAEFERMEAKSKEKSREVQAVILRLNSLLAGLSVTPMEAIGEQVQFSPQKHQAIDSSVVEPSETVVIVERGYLIRDHNEKNRLLKSALVKKP